MTCSFSFSVLMAAIMICNELYSVRIFFLKSHTVYRNALGSVQDKLLLSFSLKN